MNTATDVKPRYKTASFEKMYRMLLTQAGDETSDLYKSGQPHVGNEIQKAFWASYVGTKLHYVVPNTLLSVAVMAGKEWARLCKKDKK